MIHFGKTATFFWLCVCAATISLVRAQDGNDSMYLYLRSRADSRPDDASAWRMLGTYVLQRGNFSAASTALEQAVSLDPSSAAAHHDLGQCYLGLGRTVAAAEQFRLAMLVAPGSEYADQATELLAQLPSPPQILPVSYDVRRLDGSTMTRELTESAHAASDAPRSLYLTFDVGAAYNSNVTLTPVSRAFGATEQESAQGFFNPVIEYRMINNDFWGVGPSFTGYFSINENDAFRSLNLQSYQPGFFAERTVCCPMTILVPKLAYDYTVDQFDGVTFGNRHALTASLTSLWDRGDTSVLYWATNFTDFADDGADPATSSRDGWTYSTGASHVWPVGWRLLSAVIVGGDVEWADTQGSDFAYFGGTLYTGIEIPFTETIWCELEAGWGMRDYYESTITPSRNETLWRGSAKVTKQFTPRWALAGVFNFDRFASNNALYDAERFIAGMLTTFTY